MLKKKLKIRQENSTDYSEVYELVKKSFATTSFSDGTEQDYLNELRNKNYFIPKLSLVTENNDGKIIGQIVLHKMEIISHDKKYTELALSPISVHPEYFHKGIARSMLDQATKIALKLGYGAIFLCGNPNIYTKLGFRPSFEFNIYHINDRKRNADWCMVKELKKGTLKNIKGTINIE